MMGTGFITTIVPRRHPPGSQHPLCCSLVMDARNDVRKNRIS